MSFLLVVVGIFSLLAMMALAIDVVTLYTAKSEAQKAADAAALAGAKMFVLSGSTSTTGSGVLPSALCTNGAGGSTPANKLAAAVAGANTVGGAAATITDVTCTTSNDQNPRVTVTVGRSNLPLFFERIFGNRTASVSAKATAEAFNNSGGTVQISVGSVKPWVIPNCQGALPCVSGTDYFVDTGSGYALKSPTSYLGTQITFSPGKSGGTISHYFPIDFSQPVPPIKANACPNVAGTCAGLDLGEIPYYVDNIACATNNSPNQRVSCGDNVYPIDPTIATNVPVTDTVNATRCLIHSAGGGGQDTINLGNPVTIDGGARNPNLGLRGVGNISRSDSVVTVPVVAWAALGTTDPCQTPNSNGVCPPQPVIGFLQLGIRNVDGAGKLDTVVINAVGCNPASSGTPVTGGAVSPIPVRLIQ